MAIFFSTNLFAQTDTIQSVKLQLKWKHQFQFAGYYMAKEKGFYKDVGLDVEIKEFQKDYISVDDIQSRVGVYSVGYPSVILDKANGAKIVLLSSTYQVSPHILLSLKSSHIKSIKDFKNKIIMIDKNAIKTISFTAMMRANHLNMENLNLKEPTFNIETLVNGEADVMSAFLSNEPYILEKMGIPYDVWNPQDYGFDFYDDILFTSQKELDENPHRVNNFREASLKGLEYAFSHVDETIELILKKYNTQHRTKEALLYEAKVLHKLIYDENREIGTLKLDKIKRILDLYCVLGLVKKRVNLNKFIYVSKVKSALTTEEKEYIKNKKVIHICIDPDWMPFESLKNGKYIGISADYFKIIGKKLPIEVLHTSSWKETLELARARKCDVLPLAMETPKRKKYLNFTRPYLEIPIVLATKNDRPYINDLSMLKGKKLGVTTGYAFGELLKVKYPSLTIVDVKSVKDGLEQVENGNLYGYIGSLVSVGYLIQKEFVNVLKISSKVEGSWKLGVAVRNDDLKLLNIMQKSIDNIDEEVKQKILNNWISVNYTTQRDYKLIFETIIIAMFIIILLLFIYNKERKLKKELELQNILLDTTINTVPNPMFYKNAEGIYISANTAFTNGILGLSRDEIVGKTLYDLDDVMPKKLISIYIQEDAKLFRERKDRVYEAQVKLYDGSIREFRIQKNLFYSHNNEFLGYVGMMYDITEIKQKEKKLELLASTDSMTKLYNRRYFMNIGKDIFNCAIRDSKELSIVMFDIDNFKNVNDSYGHDIGDEVIIAIAKVLKNSSRKSDIACRFGGEEFIVLLPETSKNGAFTRAEKIRKEIEKLNFNESKKLFNVSVSVGVSTLLNEQKLESLIKRADIALYKAKESGKNRVCVS